MRRKKTLENNQKFNRSDPKKLQNLNLKKSFMLLPLSSLLFSSFAIAETLESINVDTEEVETNKPSTIKKSYSTIQNEMIRDTKDLVRYSTGVGIADNGRRSKGFAMRGVEGNRVAITIDGISVPAFEENSLYNRFGNFNNSRLSIDSELVRNIDIVKGADSFNQGSGSLGGGVSYHTLNAQDITDNNNGWAGFIRSGYASKNDEWVYTASTAYQGEKVDAILLYSQRRGHEMESRGGNITPWAQYPVKCYSWDTEERCAEKHLEKQKEIETDANYGTRRIHPDPEDHRYHSYLAKINYQINAAHKVGASLSGQKQNQYTWEHSYDYSLGGWREVDDYARRLNLNFYHLYTPEDASVLSKFRTDLDYMNAYNGAINYKGKRQYGDKSVREPMDKLDNRKMYTQFYRTQFTSEFQPFQLWGTDHLITLKANYSERHFENKNIDKYLETRDDATHHLGDVTYTQKYTIQRPVKNKAYELSLQDNIFINDTFSSILGLKYSHEIMDIQPYEKDYPCSNNCLWAEEKEPPKNTTFVNLGGNLGLTAQLNEDWSLGYNLGTGYRVPTASEMIFTYRNPAGNWLANPNLKPEKSLNHNLFLQGNGNLGSFNLNLHYSQYRDFLFQKESFMSYPIEFDKNGQHYICGVNFDCGSTGVAYTIGQQMVNLDSAKIYGFEVEGRLQLSEVLPLPEGFSTMGGLSYTKGKLSNGDSLLSLQPLKLVLGLDYQAPNDKFGIFTRATYNRGKKAGDAKVTNHYVSWKDHCQEWEETFDPWFGPSKKCVKPGDGKEESIYNWLNQSYWTFDVFGFYKPIKSLTLRAGVYNLFNKKYHTWDSLRGINKYSTTNAVADDGQGLERFYAPGRNFSASLEYKF